MKTLKFKPHLAEMILRGEKTSTWRLFDDKYLQTGDELDFVNSETGEKFGEAKIIKMWEKTLGTVDDTDYDGHEKYGSEEYMIGHFRGYYGDKVNRDTPVKIMAFELKK